MSLAQTVGSFSDLDIEYSELKLAYEKVSQENQRLRQMLGETEKTIADMRENLATSKGEVEVFKRQAMELKLRSEALGLGAGGADNAKLEQRLLEAVRELRSLADQKRNLSAALIRLTDAASVYAKGATGADAETRLALEVEIRNGGTALGSATSNSSEAAALSATITDGEVISIKDELALVVMNIGRKQGVKEGMPFEVIRGDQIIGYIRVVDVRDAIAGAVIQSLTSERERIKNGDHLKVDAQQ